MVVDRLPRDEVIRGGKSPAPMYHRREGAVMSEKRFLERKNYL